MEIPNGELISKFIKHPIMEIWWIKKGGTLIKAYVFKVSQKKLGVNHKLLMFNLMATPSILI